MPHHVSQFKKRFTIQKKRFTIQTESAQKQCQNTTQIRLLQSTNMNESILVLKIWCPKASPQNHQTFLTGNNENANVFWSQSTKKPRKETTVKTELWNPSTGPRKSLCRCWTNANAVTKLWPKMSTLHDIFDGWNIVCKVNWVWEVSKNDVFCPLSQSSTISKQSWIAIHLIQKHSANKIIFFKTAAAVLALLPSDIQANHLPTNLCKQKELCMRKKSSKMLSLWQSNPLHAWLPLKQLANLAKEEDVVLARVQQRACWLRHLCALPSPQSSAEQRMQWPSPSRQIWFVLAPVVSFWMDPMLSWIAWDTAFSIQMGPPGIVWLMCFCSMVPMMPLMWKTPWVSLWSPILFWMPRVTWVLMFKISPVLPSCLWAPKSAAIWAMDSSSPVVVLPWFEFWWHKHQHKPGRDIGCPSWHSCSVRCGTNLQQCEWHWCGAHGHETHPFPLLHCKCLPCPKLHRVKMCCVWGAEKPTYETSHASMLLLQETNKPTNQQNEGEWTSRSENCKFWIHLTWMRHFAKDRPTVRLPFFFLWTLSANFWINHARDWNFRQRFGTTANRTETEFVRSIATTNTTTNIRTLTRGGKENLLFVEGERYPKRKSDTILWYLVLERRGY